MRSFPLAVCVLLLAGPALADAVQLTNGDVINGKIISVNGLNVTMESEIHGTLVISRKRVSAINFGKRPANNVAGEVDKAKKKKNQFNLPLEKLGNPRALLNPNANAKTPQDVVRELQKKGVGPKTMSELTQQMPLLAFPQVQGYFNDKVGGLISGRLNLQDIRKDALKARAGLLDLKKDLGAEGAALDGYLHVLNGFLDKTDPANAKPVQPPKGIPPRLPFRDPK